MHEIVLGSGSSPCTIAFVGEKPGEEEAAQGLGFVGKSGTLLWLWAWQYARLRREDVWVTNLDKRFVPGNPDPTPEDIAEWGPLLLDELRDNGTQVAVTLGRFASSYLTGLPYTMETLHGRGWPDCHGLGIRVVPIFHPAGGLHRDSLLAYTAEGLRKLGALLEELPLNVNGGSADYRELTGSSLPRSMHFPRHLPVDTEGWVDNPWCITFSLRPGEAYLIPAKSRRLVTSFASRLASEHPILVFHNAQWDLKVLRAMGIDVIAMGLDYRDTIIYVRNLKVEPYGLKNLARRHLGMKMAEYSKVVGPVEEEFAWRYLLPVAKKAWPKEGRKHTPGRRVLAALDRHVTKGESLVGWWKDKRVTEVKRVVEVRLGATMPRPGFDDMPHKRFVRYACRDADATGRLLPIVQAEARGLGAERVVELEHAALPLVECMEQVGMQLDVGRLRKLGVALQVIMDETRAICAELSGDPEFNPGSSEQVAEWCRKRWIEHGDCGIEKTTGKGATSTDDDALKAIRLDHPMIEYVLEYRQAETLKTSYVQPLPVLLDADGVYRPKFGYVRESEEKTAGGRTETGRLKERLLTIPTRSELGREIRCAFRPVREGDVFVSGDYSQIELRLAAELSGDKAMHAAFASGKDFHTDTAINILGASESAPRFDEKRFVAKTSNFALIYLASAKTLWEKFRAEGISGYDVQAVEEMRQDWFRLYKGIPRYYQRQVAYAKAHGYVKTRLGRVRFLPGIYCDELKDDRGKLQWWPYGYLFDRATKIAGNHPIQGGVTDLILQAMATLWEILGPQASPRMDAEPALQIHDDLMVQTPKWKAVEVGALLRSIMLKQRDEYRVPIEVKVKTGETWGELH